MFFFSFLISEMIRVGKRDVLGSCGRQGEVVGLKCVLHNRKHWARSQQTLALPRAFCVILANFLL